MHPQGFQCSVCTSLTSKSNTEKNYCSLMISSDIIEQQMAMAAVARRRRLLNDDVIISLADTSWELLDISGSDVSDFGLGKVVEICKSLRAVDIRYKNLNLFQISMYFLILRARLSQDQINESLDLFSSFLYTF